MVMHPTINELIVAITTTFFTFFRILIPDLEKQTCKFGELQQQTDNQLYHYSLLALPILRASQLTILLAFATTLLSLSFGVIVAMILATVTIPVRIAISDSLFSLNQFSASAITSRC